MAARVTAGERQRRRAVIQQRVADGESQRSIANAFGVSRALVQKELRAIREGETVLDPITPRRRPTGSGWGPRCGRAR